MSQKQQHTKPAGTLSNATGLTPAGPDLRAVDLAARLFVARTSTPGQTTGYSAAGIAAKCVADAREFYRVLDATPTDTPEG